MFRETLCEHLQCRLERRRARRGVPRAPEGMFWEMLCEHLQCRLESRRARRGSAGALVGVGGWVTHLTMSANALTFTRQARRLRSQGGGLRSSQGLFGDMLCEHIQCRLESRRARRGSADALVGVGGWVTHLRLPWERGRLARCVVVAEGQSQHRM